MAGRFIVGLMELPITNSCRVVNASFKFQDYTNSTCKFSEHGLTIFINADALLTNVSVKCSRMISMHGGFRRR
jgi:hypothetical protein